MPDSGPIVMGVGVDLVDVDRLDARFAAKEAVMKALGMGWRAMAWREIEIATDPRGPGLHKP